MIDGGDMRIRHTAGCLLVKVNRPTNHLYILNAEVASPVYLAMKGVECAWLWHARFRHLNFPALCKPAREEIVRGLPEVDQADQICSGCLVGKHRRASFPHQAEYMADVPLELVHGDLCGPITPATTSGSHYFILLVDDNSRFMWLRTLRSKDQAADAIKLYQ
jgi:hypothetical protein